MTWELIGELIKTYGVPLAFALIFVFRDFQTRDSYKQATEKQLEEYKKRDEKRDADTEQLLNRYHEDFIKMSDALNANTGAINLLSKLIESVLRTTSNDNK